MARKNAWRDVTPEMLTTGRLIVEALLLAHPDPRDEPNVGRTHSNDLVASCGLCRCGAHNAEDDPNACADCATTVKGARC